MNRCVLTVLAPEVLDLIAKELPITDYIRLLKTCWTLYHIACRLLYRDVELQGRPARLFFSAIVCDKRPDANYGSFVRSLTYTVSGNADIYLAYPVFCKALTRMSGLIAMTLYIPPKYSTFLLSQMRHYNIIRQTQPTASIPSGVHEPDGAHSRPVIPCLRELLIAGDIKFLEIARYRSMVAINIIDSIGYPGLAYVIEVLTSRDLSESITIRRLGLYFDFPTGLEAHFALGGLASAFPALHDLSIYTPHINALHISQMLSQSPSLFSQLKTLSINYVLIRQPRFLTPKDTSLKIQRSHIVAAGSLRPSLVGLHFGSIWWFRDTRSRDGWNFRNESDAMEADGFEFNYDDDDDENDDVDGDGKPCRTYPPEIFFHDIPFKPVSL